MKAGRIVVRIVFSILAGCSTALLSAMRESWKDYYAVIGLIFSMLLVIAFWVWLAVSVADTTHDKKES